MAEFSRVGESVVMDALAGAVDQAKQRQRGLLLARERASQERRVNRAIDRTQGDDWLRNGTVYHRRW